MHQRDSLTFVDHYSQPLGSSTMSGNRGARSNTADAVELLKEQTRKMDEQLQQLRARVAADRSRWESTLQKNDGVYWSASKPATGANSATASLTKRPILNAAAAASAGSSAGSSRATAGTAKAAASGARTTPGKPSGTATRGASAPSAPFADLVVTGGTVGKALRNPLEVEPGTQTDGVPLTPSKTTAYATSDASSTSSGSLSSNQALRARSSIVRPPRPGSATRTSAHTGNKVLNMAALSVQAGLVQTGEAPSSAGTVQLQKVAVAPRSARSKADIAEALALASKNAAESATASVTALPSAPALSHLALAPNRVVRPPSAGRAPKPVSTTTSTITTMSTSSSTMTGRARPPSATVGTSTADVSDYSDSTPAPGSLLIGAFDEAANAREFAEARRAWLASSGLSQKTTADVGCDALTATSEATASDGIVPLPGSLLASAFDGNYDEEANAADFAAARIAWLRETDPEAAKRAEEEEAAKRARRSQALSAPKRPPKEGEPGYLLYGEYDEARNAREFLEARNEFLGLSTPGTSTTASAAVAAAGDDDDDEAEDRPPGSLLEGPMFNEEESRASFAEARRQWLESIGQAVDDTAQEESVTQRAQPQRSSHIASAYAAEKAGIIPLPPLDATTEDQKAMAQRSKDLWDSIASKLDLGSLLPNVDSSAVGPDASTEGASGDVDKFGLSSARGVSVSEGPIEVKSLLLSRPLSARHPAPAAVDKPTRTTASAAPLGSVQKACYNCYKLVHVDQTLQDPELNKVFCSKECTQHFKTSIEAKRKETQAQLEQIKAALQALQLEAEQRKRVEDPLETESLGSDQADVIEEHGTRTADLASVPPPAETAEPSLHTPRDDSNVTPSQPQAIVRAQDPKQVVPIVMLPDDDEE